MPNHQQPTSNPADDFVAPPCNALVEILYQDDDILLLNKPSGLLSLSGKNPLNWDSVHYRLVHGQAGISPAFPEAKLPQRLDFGTSGIMVASLHAASAKDLNRQFQERSVQKRYFAMLEGWLTTGQGTITAAIAKDTFPMMKLCERTGKAASTEYTVLQRFENPRRSLVQFAPITGRTHQLRIHSLAIGHAILGCDLYNSVNSENLAARLLLHASDLYFKHPVSQQPFHGQSPCPF